MKYPNVEAELARNGMTREKLAGELGVTRSTLYLWMRAGKIPQAALVKMADIFEVSIDYLLGRSSSKA